MLPIVGPIRYEALPVFLLYHCVNIAVLLTAVVLYLHPFDAARPSMLWIVFSHVVAFVSLAMVVGQVLLFSEREDGGIGPSVFPGSLHLRSYGGGVCLLGL